MGFEILGLNAITSAGVVGLVLLLMAIMKKYDTKKTKKWATGFGVVLVGLFLVTAFVPSISQSASWLTAELNLKTQSAGDTGTIPGGDLPKGECAEGFVKINGNCVCGTEDTTVTFSAVDKYTGTATGGTHRYTINGGTARTVSDAGTVTMSPGDVIKALLGNASVSDKYFGKVITATVPCKGTFEIPDNKMIQNETSALDVDFFNKDGIKMDGGALANGNQTLGDSDKQSIRLRWLTPSQKGYPHGVLAVFEYNRTAFDKFEAVGLQPASTPDFYSVGTTFRTTTSYVLPGREDVGESEYIIEVSSSSNGPVVSDATSNGVNVTFYPLDYYIDEDNGGAFAGPAVEDEDNVATFPHTGSVVNIYFA